MNLLHFKSYTNFSLYLLQIYVTHTPATFQHCLGSWQDFIYFQVWEPVGLWDIPCWCTCWQLVGAQRWSCGTWYGDKVLIYTSAWNRWISPWWWMMKMLQGVCRNCTKYSGLNQTGLCWNQLLKFTNSFPHWNGCSFFPSKETFFSGIETVLTVQQRAVGAEELREASQIQSTPHLLTGLAQEF